MSTLNIREIVGKNGLPVSFPTGINIGPAAFGTVNNIGIAGGPGFGVGICPGPLPAGMVSLPGYADPLSDNYGNYQFTDGSVMVWIPAFFYKWGTGSNGLALNDIDIKPFNAYATVAAAATAGYALHRAFYDGGGIQLGVFVDKYLCSNNGGIASSLRLGNPLSSNSANNPFGGLTGTPGNNLGGAIASAKTRGSNFFCSSRFIFVALAMLSYAHGRASTNTTYNAWYFAGTTNFPKGVNNNALRDTNDTEVLFIGTGYLNAGKTGSANLFARTTHNGMNSGVADLNGCMWEVTPGLTSDGTNYYILKTSVSMKNVTGGNSTGTDLFGATGITALYDSLGATFKALVNNGTNRAYGSASQMFDTATSGNAWNAVGFGIPEAGGIGGTNAFGNDLFRDDRINESCPRSGGAWSNAADAGVWALNLDGARSGSGASSGFRSALYL